MEPRIETPGPLEFVGVAVFGGATSTPEDAAWRLFGDSETVPDEIELWVPAMKA